MSRSILITGASGFIGGFLVEEALKRNMTIYAGVRNRSNLQYLKDSRIKFVNLNFSSKNELADSLKSLSEKIGNIDIVIHNAGMTKALSPEIYFEVNTNYTINLIDAISSAGISLKKFIYISSLASYGPGSNITFNTIKDSDTPNPLTDYGKSKLKAEEAIKRDSSLRWVIIRPTAVYGPREKEIFMLFKLINRNIQTWIKCKGQKMTFIYVKDLTRAVLDIAESSHYHKSYFLSDGGVYTSELFSHYIKKHLKKKTLTIPISANTLNIFASILEKASGVVGKTPGLNKEKAKEMTSLNWVCDINPLCVDIGYSPAFSLEDGIKETVAWYKQAAWLK